MEIIKDSLAIVGLLAIIIAVTFQMLMNWGQRIIDEDEGDDR